MTTEAGRLLLEDGERSIAGLSLTPLAGRHLLLTGASGLIGSHLLAGLASSGVGRQGTQVSVVLRGEPPEHIAPFLGLPWVHVLRGDLSNAGFRAGLPTFDFGIHAACYAQPGLFLADPVTTLALGTEVTLDLLRRVNPHGTLLFLSSSEIYSGLSDPPFGEARTGAVPPDHPRSCYIEAKRCGEVICHAFRSRGVAAKVARVSLAYGPGTRRGDRRALNMFIEKSLSRGEVDLLDAGLAVRTYAYASDVAEVLWRIALEGRDWLYNVGGESTTTVADLARLIGSQTGASVRFPASSAPLAGAPEEVRLDLGKIRAEFGKTRFVSLEEGIARTIRWQRSLYGP